MAALGKDNDGRPLNSMTGQALVATYDATISGTTQIDLNANTRMIEVAAIDKAVFMKWGATAASSTAFDAVIPANTTRIFRVPANITSVNFIEQAATGILAVTEF